MRGASSGRLVRALIEQPLDVLQRQRIDRGLKLCGKRHALGEKNKTVTAGCGCRLACHLLCGINRRSCVGLHRPIMLACQAGGKCLVRNGEICFGREGGAEVSLGQGNDIGVGEICGRQGKAIGGGLHQLFIVKT